MDDMSVVKEATDLRAYKTDQRFPCERTSFRVDQRGPKSDDRNTHAGSNETKLPWKNPKSKQKTIVPAFDLRSPIHAKIKIPETAQLGCRRVGSSASLRSDDFLAIKHDLRRER